MAHPQFLSKLHGKKVLITGSDGFIGSHLVEQCVKLGANVRAFVWYSATNNWGWLEHIDPEIKDQIEVFAGDICDPFGVHEAMHDCDIVFHLAALIAIPYSYHSPRTYLDTNVNGTLNVLQAARELNVERVIHTSTSEVYGSAQFVPITEAHPLNAQSPYAASKIAADQLVHSYFCSFGTPVVTIRPFNTYGPRQSSRAVIPTIISQIASGASRVKLGALAPTRDFNYIDDTVAGFIHMATTPNIEGQTFNVGSEFEVSIGKTAEMILQLMNSNIELCQEKERHRPAQSEVERLFASSQKIQQVCQWSPAYSGLSGFRKGLEKTIDWFTEPAHLQCYKPNYYTL